MKPPRATLFLRVMLGALVFLLAIGGWPMISRAGSRAASRSLAERLRDGPGASNHPVHVRPSGTVRIPRGWPLADDGSLTCLTCHDKLPPLEGASHAYLRDFAEEEADTLAFCVKCHSDDTTRTATAQHWMAVGVAHVPDDDRRPHRSGGLLDADSRRCMACHDGVGADEAVNSTVWNRGSSPLDDRRRNHPIGVSYPSHTPRNYGVPFRPISMLPAGIRLPDGKVSCVSCHDLYASDRHHLSVPIEGSALCFACHQMD